jgi:hypothetical protein
MRLPIALLPGLCLSAACLAGCGGAPEVMELSEQAKKSIIQRKVDVKQREALSPRPRAQPSRLQRSGQSP